MPSDPEQMDVVCAELREAIASPAFRKILPLLIVNSGGANFVALFENNSYATPSSKVYRTAEA